jgi:hypothetical protein
MSSKLVGNRVTDRAEDPPMASIPAVAAPEPSGVNTPEILPVADR